MKIEFSFFLLLLSSVSSAQLDTMTTSKQQPVLFSGYIEAYYAYDFNQPSDNKRPNFFYNYNRYNEFTVNLGFLKAYYNMQRVRANLALGVGTYMNANYTAEPGVFKNVLEANAGYKLSHKNNVWLDMGIMPSHIGFESAIGKDCWILTRSIVAENSPYFESGIRLSYTSNKLKLFTSVLALNGWQRIQRLNGSSSISWGTQVQWKPSDKILFNYSTFIGTDKPDSNRLWRIYHDLYSIMQLNTIIGVTIGFDMASEQKSKNSSKQNIVYSPVFIIRFTPVDPLALAVRGEYYSDPDHVLITTRMRYPFRTMGASVNIDYIPMKNMLLRWEGRLLRSQYPIFIKRGTFKRDDLFVTTSLVVSF